MDQKQKWRTFRSKLRRWLCREISVRSLKLRRYLHEFLFGALGADDILSVGDETFADQRGLALRADEAVVVPVAVLE